MRETEKMEWKWKWRISDVHVVERGKDTVITTSIIATDDKPISARHAPKGARKSLSCVPNWHLVLSATNFLSISKIIKKGNKTALSIFCPCSRPAQVDVTPSKWESNRLLFFFQPFIWPFFWQKEGEKARSRAGEASERDWFLSTSLL